MTVPSSPTNKPDTAVVFIGNAGAGKSTLLSQLGGDFESGVSFMEGLTKEVSEQVVTLNGRQVILMDVPGLYEFDNEATMSNAEKLSEALTRGYKYKLFLVLKADSRGLTPMEIALMSTVNKYIRQSNGDKVDFRVIINQIGDDTVYDMINDRIAKDNFKDLLASPKLDGYGLDIQIKGVMLVRFDEAALVGKHLKEDLSKEVEAQVEIPLRLEEDFKAENKDIDQFSVISVSNVVKKVSASQVLGAIGPVVCVAAVGLYQSGLNMGR
jgi:tRNA U34 5-carboxymethylaminomethyl modifying GTPase MnmE/TrmE